MSLSRRTATTDLAIFAGDVMEWIRHRIVTCDGVIALLNASNPNVYLELGYAWARHVPTILVIKKDQIPPFDVRGHRYIHYESIWKLREEMKNVIGDLKRQGALVRPHR